MSDEQTAWAELVTMQLRRFDAELMEIREGLAELDGAKAPHAAVERAVGTVSRRVDALHTRIDEIEAR